MTDILRRARLELTAKELDAFTLHHAGSGYRAIADRLGISVSSARDRVARARARLGLPRARTMTSE